MCGRLIDGLYLLALLAPRNLLPLKNVQCAGVGGQALFFGIKTNGSYQLGMIVSASKERPIRYVRTANSSF